MCLVDWPTMSRLRFGSNVRSLPHLCACQGGPQLLVSLKDPSALQPEIEPDKKEKKGPGILFAPGLGMLSCTNGLVLSVSVSVTVCCRSVARSIDAQSIKYRHSRVSSVHTAERVSAMWQRIHLSSLPPLPIQKTPSSSGSFAAALTAAAGYTRIVVCTDTRAARQQSAVSTAWWM